MPVLPPPKHTVKPAPKRISSTDILVGLTYALIIFAIILIVGSH